jgi:3-oxoacyl-[acyl-carrier-protein] synthase I
MIRQRRVAVTGLGFITSIGNDGPSVERSLREMRHGIERVDLAPGRGIPVKVVGTIKGFDVESPYWSKWTWPSRYQFPPTVLRSAAPHVLHALCAATQAIEDARLDPAQVSDENTALFTASVGSPSTLRNGLNTMHADPAMRGPPMGIVSAVAGTLNFNLGTHFRIRGGNCGFVSACSSSSHAIGYAFDEISRGRFERILVVGGEELGVDSVLPFMSMGALSACADPDAASRPFDRKRDGFVASGGAVAFVLESEDEAARRGVGTYAEVLGWGQSSDGYSVALPDPDGQGLRRAMERALASAALKPGDIGYVNAHATSTPRGDASEALALAALFTRSGAHPQVSSTKGLTGHTLSMAGAMEAGFCALALRGGFIPGNAGLNDPDPACEGLDLPRSSVDGAPGIVMSNSAGFGGSNVVLLFAPWPS